MPTRSSSGRNLVEQIDELRKKLQLLEGDRKAYYETAEYSMKQNQEKITTLRSENKHLRKTTAEKLSADEHVVSRGLEENPVERKALRNKPSSVALVVMDEKVQDRVNALNSARYVTRRKQEKLDDLKARRAVSGGGGGSGGGRSGGGGGGGGGGSNSGRQSSDSGQVTEANATESEDAQKLRSLENRLDKSNLKCKEAEHIQKTYQQIRSRLQDEHKTFSNTLDDMEQEIQRMKRQLKELQVIRTDAQLVRDNARAELERQEKEIYADRKQREIEIQRVRREAEEKRVQQELFQRRIAARQSVGQDNLTSDQRQILGMGEEDQEKIHSYEDAFRKIKEATGVSDTQEVVLRFESQGNTQQHLEKLKGENERHIEALIEDKEKLQEEFEQMKYTGEDKLSSGERLLEEFQSHVTEDEANHDEALVALEKSSKTLTNVKSGVEHLFEKLKSLKTAASDVQRTKTSPTSDEYVLDQLSICEEKLSRLLEDLESSGKDVGQVSRRMEEDEFHNSVDLKLPAYNTRVKLPTVQKETIYDEDISGEDEDVPTRKSLKDQSQQLVDAKTRRRPGKKRKKIAK